MDSAQGISIGDPHYLHNASVSLQVLLWISICISRAVMLWRRRCAPGGTRVLQDSSAK